MTQTEFSKKLTLIANYAKQYFKMYGYCKLAYREIYGDSKGVEHRLMVCHKLMDFVKENPEFMSMDMLRERTRELAYLSRQRNK